MRRLLSAMFALTAAIGVVNAAPAKAAPEKPQCGWVMPCEGPIERLQRLCEQARCETP